MLFPTFDFLLFCVPVLVIGWALHRRAGPRTWFLLAASYFFYMAAPKTDPLPTPWYYVGLLVFATVLDYGAGLAIAAQDVGLTSKYPEDQRRARRNRNLILGISLVGNLGLLGYYKYTDFFVHTAADVLTALGLPSFVPTIKLLLPVGISFYTFQSLSYTIDVWRGRLTAGALVQQVRAVRHVLPAARRGPDRARERVPAAAAPRAAADAVAHGRGDVPHPQGPGEEGRAGRLDRRAAHRCDLRLAGELHVRRAARRAVRVHAAALLRLLGLLGHRDRRGAPARLRLPGELRSPVPVARPRRVLAALAHDAVHVAARLPVFPARRLVADRRRACTSTCG